MNMNAIMYASRAARAGGSLLLDWIMEIPVAQQAGVFLAKRGCGICVVTH